jgi:hypothetical protein
MNKTILKVLIMVGFLLPLFFVFRSFLGGTSLIWGDAPYFNSINVKELFSEPALWTQRGNNFGGINLFLWLSPWMFIYGFLGKFLSLDNSLIIRFLFYFPSLILSVIGPLCLCRYLKLGKITSFFAAFLYVFNTYYLLLVDGGQIGVALAYGLFPFVILSLKKIIDKRNINNFILGLVLSFLLTSIEPRFFLIAILTIIVWFLFDWLFDRKAIVFKNLWQVFLIGLAIVLLNSYWLYPMLKTGGLNLGTSVAGLQLISLLNGLFLYQPHWPNNFYGDITYPPFYYLFIPILVFANLLFLKNKKTFSLIGIFLFFIFLLKGTTPPFGGIYGWLITKIPFLEAFRDSSKFFVPLCLTAGILIGNTVEEISQKYKKLVFIPFVLYAYLLFLVYPALSQKLNWNLSLRNPKEMAAINNLLKNDQDGFKSLWIYQKPPLYFESSDKPALDANRLIDFRPFASLNAGSYDALNFMHQGNWQDWFNLLGIKYLILNGNEKKLSYKENEVDDWNKFTTFLAKEKSLVKEAINSDISVYRLSETKPLIFGVQKLLVVVGPDDIYEKIEKDYPSFSRANQGFVFAEDGSFDLSQLTSTPTEALAIVYNGKSQTDLIMSSLQKYFISVNNSSNSKWKIWSPQDYLEWKFQLLMRGLKSREFDYQKGIALSTQGGEQIGFNLKVPKKGDYVLAFRLTSASDSAGVKIKFNNTENIFKTKKADNYEWFIEKPINLSKGKQRLTIENAGGVNVLNVVALIPLEDLKKTEGIVEEFLKTKDVYDYANLGQKGNLVTLLKSQKWQKIEYDKTFILTNSITVPKGVNWVVMSQTYNQGWKLLKNVEYFDSLPFYSMINGFYVSNKWEKLSLVFKGQQQFRWGVWLSLVSMLTTTAAILYFWSKDEK